MGFSYKNKDSKLFLIKQTFYRILSICVTEGKKDLWNVTDKKLECYGSRNI